MLEEIRIRSLGVIEDATLPLGPGLTVLTGETGAGKTMVVTGLALLLGGRADGALVRRNSAQASVEGRLRLDRLDRDARVSQRATEAGADFDDDGTLIVARTVLAEGRSRAHLGGRSVPVGLLAELADDLVAVHGQSEQLGLLRPAAQRAALDRYAGPAHAALLAELGTAYTRWHEVSADLADRTGRARERRQEADLLRHGLAEIAELAPEPGEDDRLSTEARRLANADDLRLAAETAHTALAGDLDGTSTDVDASSLLGSARRSLEQVDDPDLGALAARIGEAIGTLADVAGDLAAYGSQLDADPARLATVEDRRAALRSVTRKYADSVDGTLVWAQEAQARLAQLDGSEETLAALATERDALAARTAELAGKVSRSRAKAGNRFAAAVTTELAALAMRDASIVVAMHRRPAVAGAPHLTVGTTAVGIGPDGYDEVAIQLVPHLDAEPRPVQRGASGGELSRLMLAIEVVLAGNDPVPTMIFDEVDAGVGGQAAIEVGRRLSRLARDHQVVVVTHLPQVAAYADRHLVVRRDTRDGTTRTEVRRLEDAERARELARMLAGLADSEVGQAHAEELVALADRDRAAVEPVAGPAAAAGNGAAPGRKKAPATGRKAARKPPAKPRAKAAQKSGR